MSSKKSSRRFQDIIARRFLESVLKKTSCKNILKTSSRRLRRGRIFTLKMSSRRLGKQEMFAGLNLIFLVFPYTSYFLSFFSCYPCFCNLVLPTQLFPLLWDCLTFGFSYFPLLHLVDLTIFCCFLMIWITFIVTCNAHWKTKFIWGRFREWDNKSEQFREQTTLKRTG